MVPLQRQPLSVACATVHGTRIEPRKTPRTWGVMIRRTSSVRIFILIFLVQIVADTTSSRASDACNGSSDLLRGVRRIDVPLTGFKTFEYCLCDNLRCDLREVGVKGAVIVASCVQGASHVYAQRGARLPAASRCTHASASGVVVVVDDDEPFGPGKSPPQYIPQNIWRYISRVSDASRVARPPLRRTWAILL